MRNVTSSDDYKKCIDAAICVQEAQFLVDVYGDQHSEYFGHEFCAAGVRQCLDCRSPAGRIKTRIGSIRYLQRVN